MQPHKLKKSFKILFHNVINTILFASENQGFPLLATMHIKYNVWKKNTTSQQSQKWILKFCFAALFRQYSECENNKKSFSRNLSDKFSESRNYKVVIPTNLAYETYILPLFLTDSVILPHLPLSTSLNEFNKNNFSVHYFPIFLVTFFNVVRIWNWKRFHYTLDDLYLIDIFIKTSTWCCQQLFLTMGKIPESSKKIDHVVKICFTLLNIVFNSCRMSFSII